MATFDWKYVLDSDALGKTKLLSAPDGWEAPATTIARNKSWKGMFRQFTTKLKFWGDGKDYIKRIYEVNGSEHEIRIGIYKYITPQNKYILDFSGVVNLSVYKESELYVEVNIHEESFYQKIKARSKTKVNVADTTSIDSEDIGSFDSAYFDYVITEKGISEVTDYTLNESNATLAQEGTVPMQIGASSIAEAQTPVNPAYNPPSADSFFIKDAPNTAEYRIQGRIKATLSIPLTLTHTWDFNLQRGNALYEHEFAKTTLQSGTLGGGQSVDIDFDFDETIALNASWPNLSLNINTLPDIGLTTVFEITDVSIVKTLTEGTSPIKAPLIHEVFERVVESYTGLSGRFKSDFFGRADLPQYQVTGEYAESALLSGLAIRGFDDPLSISLDDLFSSVSAMWGLGMGIETLNGVSKLVVEPYQYFYSNRVSIAFHDVPDLEKAYVKDMAFSNVSVGYDKVEYEDQNTLKEPNNKAEYATIIKSNSNDFNAVSKIRTDAIGIELTRRKKKDLFPDEDTKLDKSIFLIISDFDGVKYKPRLNINYYTSIEGIYSPETAYNLDVTPARMLRNNGGEIRAGLDKYTDSTIKHTFQNIASGLISQRADELNPIDEAASVPVSDLDFPLWKPENYTFTAKVTREESELLKNKPKTLIKVSPYSREQTKYYYYGWAELIKIDDEKHEGEFTLLVFNDKNPNFTIIDETGLDTSAPGKIEDLPPDQVQRIVKGFNYIFDAPFDA